MNIFKNPKAKFPLRILILIISIIEVSIIYPFEAKYAGLISYSLFSTTILIQIFTVFQLTGKKALKYSALRFKSFSWFGIIIFLLVPVLIYGAPPKYTYEKGKNVIAEYLNKEGPLEFVVHKDIRPTIPVSPKYSKGFPKALLMENKFYYYGVEIEGKNKWFAINPLTGEILELEESFYSF